MRVLERICLVVALAACAFLLLERFEVIELQESSKRRERARLVTDVEDEVNAKLDDRIGASVQEQTAALQATIAADLDRKLTEESIPALKAELRRELTPADASTPAKVTAREIEITNAAGVVVVRLAANEGGGGDVTVSRNDGRRVARLYARTDHDGEVALYDDGGVLRANVGATDSGGYSNYWNRSGDMAAYVGSDSAADAGYVVIYGAKDKKVVDLFANERGGRLSVRDAASGNTIVTLGSDTTTGTGYLGMGDAHGFPGVAMFTTDEGGQIKALNRNGKTAAYLGVSASPAGNGLLYVTNKDGLRLIETGANTAGGGYTSVFNSKGKRIMYLGGSTGTDPDDGVLEIATALDKLGVVLRAYAGGSSVRIYDPNEKVKAQLR